MDFKRLNLTVLYVEDDAYTRKSIGDVLALKVEKLHVAEDGLKGLEIFKNNTIHLIISDYKMPNMNGIELCNKIKQINASVCFILLTAYNDTNLLINAINFGVDKFLQKPIEANKIFTILDDAYKKVMKDFLLEQFIVRIKEAEKIAQLSYWDVDIDRKKITFSQEAKKQFNLNGEDIDYKDFSNCIKEEDKSKFLDIFQKYVYSDSNIEETVAIENSHNNVRYIRIVAKGWKSSTHGTRHMVGIFQDVTHYELQKLRLKQKANSDPMLKIANKNFVTLELERLIKSSKRYGHSLGVIFFDIDNFKSINDEYGHLKADDLLMELVDLIKNNIRQTDLFGRWGGDEFVIVSGHSAQDSTIELTEKIRKKIAAHKWNCEASVTISIGLAFYKIGDNATSLIHRADLKMFEAKKAGKNRYSY